MLMEAETLPEQSARPISLYSSAHFPGTYHAQPGSPVRPQRPPVCDQAAVGDTLAQVAHFLKITRFFDAPLPSQEHGVSNAVGRRRGKADTVQHKGKEPENSDRGQAFAAVPATIAQDGFAAFAGIAVQKAVLPLPSHF
jgi:hypothetical protein